MLKKNIIVFGLFIGFVLVYFLWPQQEGLPVFDNIDNFELQSVHDGTYELSNGKVKVVAFFYTNCPDICPLTMYDMKKLQNKLKEQGVFGEEVELVSITLDPEVDDKQTIKDYAKAFEADPNGWKWLRESQAKLYQVLKQFQMNAKKLEGGYMAHSTTMYLVDGKEQVRGLYQMANSNEHVDVEKILKDVNHILNE